MRAPLLISYRLFSCCDTAPALRTIAAWAILPDDVQIGRQSHPAMDGRCASTACLRVSKVRCAYARRVVRGSAWPISSWTACTGAPELMRRTRAQQVLACPPDSRQRPSSRRVRTALTRLAVLWLLSNRVAMNGEAVRPKEALAAWQRLADDPRSIRIESEPATHEHRFASLVTGREPTPNLWTDAWLAALALSLDYEMTTFDRGFPPHAARSLMRINA